MRYPSERFLEIKAARNSNHLHQVDKLALSYEAKAENVPLARAAVAALAEGLGAEDPLLGDLRTVVTEACANVVRHAYPMPAGIWASKPFPRGRS